MKKILTIPILFTFILLPFQLFAQNSATLAGTVSDNSGEPLAGANIFLVENSRGAATNSDGHYNIDNIDPGTYTVRFSFVGYETITKKATLNAGQTLTMNVTLQSSVLKGNEELVVIGSRAAHTAADELAVPVDVFTTEQISSQGTSETTQILERVAPSVNFPHQTVADGTDAVRPFTLRGLSPDHTLVLINGKRRHPTALVHRLGSGIQNGSSGVDLNAIPSNAIGRLEVLRDGAAAQYGSDAIAGVVNVVLKDGAFRPRITGKLGEFNSDGYGTDGTTYDLTGDYGIPLSDKGFFDVFTQYRHRDPTNRAGADPRDQIVEGDADIVNDNGDVVQKNNPVSQPNHHWGDGETDDFYAW